MADRTIASVETAYVGWTEHRDSLVRLAGLLTGNASAAEDYAAETIARFLVARRRTNIHDPAAYLRRTLVNEVIGSARRRHTEERHRFEVARPEAQQDRSDEVTDSSQLWQAMLGLPLRQRAVLVLRFYEDRSEQETATILSMPIGTVKSTTARGLDALRAALGEDAS